MTMKQAIAHYWPKGGKLTDPFPFDARVMSRGVFHSDWLDDPENVRYLAAFIDSFGGDHIFFLPGHPAVSNIAGRQLEPVYLFKENPNRAEQITQRYIETLNKESNDTEKVKTAKLIVELFETIVEPQVTTPTFITDFPKVVSPLSKASPADPIIAERFELFIAGMECANGFSELNDPEEQVQRFNEQMGQRERGDEEAMVMDEDYIRALSYGMPPAAGIGIGIDRFVMLLTNRQSIRDVILFPHLRPERRREQPEEPGE
jgi:lysyl-tRNA synthetase class II